VTTSARAACVVGWPIGHSRSPLIHNYWLKHYGLAGEYRREAVPPEQFPDFVNVSSSKYSPSFQRGVMVCIARQDFGGSTAESIDPD
jgi:hypothetical protein